MTRRRSVQSKLDLPPIIDIQMPGFGEVDPYVVPVLSANTANVCVELTPSIIDKLNKAIKHEKLNNPLPPPKSKADRRREKGIDPGTWWEASSEKYVVPWYDNQGGYHRKYLKDEQSAREFFARAAGRELPPPDQAESVEEQSGK